MRYETVFDASRQPFHNGSFLFVGLIFSLVGAVMVCRPQAFEALGGGFSKLRERRLFSWFIFIFSLGWLLIAGTSIFLQNLESGGAAKQRNCAIAEGRVSDFHPMPPGGHDTERFKVGGVPFSYSDDVVTAGFHQSAARGGPIREGLPVRICYAGESILRLQVGR